MNRTKQPMRQIAFAGLSLALALVCGCSRPDGTATKEPRRDWPKLRDDLPNPTTNIVVILIDTLRADRMSLYGYERETTPTLDALARESVVFENAHGPAPWTLPSLPSIFTSTFSAEHGMQQDGQKLSPDLFTLAERLQRVGYHTGQYYANGYAGPGTRMARGYNDSIKAMGKELRDVTPWLDSRPDKPFYLYVHNVEPHKPHNVPDNFVDTFGGLRANIKDRVRTLRNKYRPLVRVDWSAGRKLGFTDNSTAQDRVVDKFNRILEQHNLLYDAAVRWSDNQVSAVISQLKARDVWDDTLFVVMSDHGEELNDHGAYLHSQSVYQELSRVPLLIRFPRGAHGGQRISDNLSLIDFLPTVFDYLERSDMSFDARGESLMPLINGTVQRDPDRIVTTTMRVNRKKYYKPWTTTRGNINIAMRLGDWKGIYNLELDTVELYDLAADPGEQANLGELPEHADLVQRMRTHAAELYERCVAVKKDAGVGGVEQLDEEFKTDLGALGYIGDVPSEDEAATEEEPP